MISDASAANFFSIEEMLANIFQKVLGVSLSLP
ncbi:unnamed protein product, partial [marine sediment metagenome]